MGLNDILELDYLIEEISDNTITINSTDSSEINYISKNMFLGDRDIRDNIIFGQNSDKKSPRIY